jgi:ABC-type multidrug transport system permease subunit
MQHDSGARRHFETSGRQIAAALVTGSGLGGLLILMLLISAGQRAPLALVGGWAVGTLFAGLALAAVGGPIWLLLHAIGLRRGRYAAAVTGLLGLGLFAGGQGGGAMFSLAPIDTRSWLLGLAFKLAQAAAVTLLAGGIGLAMWRIAYRPSS